MGFEGGVLFANEPGEELNTSELLEVPSLVSRRDSLDQVESVALSKRESHVIIKLKKVKQAIRRKVDLKVNRRGKLRV